MLKNYFTIALRNFWRNKTFSLINIFGLSIGISAALVIYLLVNYHFNFDKFEKDKERIYRVVTDFKFSGEDYHNSGVMGPMGKAVKREVTGLDAVIPFYTWNGQPKISIPAANAAVPVVLKNQQGVVFADENYFNMIDYEWLSGSPKTSLQKSYQIVLTETAASLYFPKLTPEQITGKTIYFDDTVRTVVTGIVKNIAENTEFNFKTFVSLATLEQTTLKPEDWDRWDNTNGASQLYVKLSAGTSKAKAENSIRNLHKKYATKDPKDNSITLHSLQPLSDVHFNATYGGYDAPLANKSTLYGLLAVAAFLLLLGCINFINLTTANATTRTKEIGIRKTMGSSRKQLIIQFLSETFLLTCTATVVSVILTPVLLKAFAGFIPENLHFNLAKQPGVLLFAVVLMLVVALLSGFYPALMLSGFKPVLVLKNQAWNRTGKTRNAWLRKTLTISQFAIAQIFIMATMLVSKQIIYSINKDQGFKKEAILYFDTNFYDTIRSHKYILIEKLKAIPEVAMVTMSSSPPSSNRTWSGSMKYKDGQKEIETDVQQKYADSNYLKLYGIRLLAGTQLPFSDTVNAFLINETYARLLGFRQPQDAIGKYLEWSSKLIPIRGVVADFNQRSLHEPIKPLTIGSWAGTERNVSIALRPKYKATDTWKSGISKIENAYKEVYPDEDFSYTFFDEDIAKYYTAEQHISSLLQWATVLAVFISCLGLLGLVIYATTQRTKEIGVRKVLGATIVQVVVLISKEFLLLILLAFVIAVPFAWVAMHKWLQNFAYKTDISWWVFLSGGLIMFVMAMLVLGIRTFRAAAANPVESLRAE